MLTCGSQLAHWCTLHFCIRKAAEYVWQCQGVINGRSSAEQPCSHEGRMRIVEQGPESVLLAYSFSCQLGAHVQVVGEAGPAGRCYAVRSEGQV